MLFAVSEVIARGENVVIALTGVRVFSDGIELLVDRHLRRGSIDEGDWRQVHEMFAEHWGRGALAPDRLRWGLVLGDGTRLFAEDRFGAPFDADPDRHTMRVNGGSGSGDDDRYTMRNQLWVHPASPRGAARTRRAVAGVRHRRVAGRPRRRADRRSRAVGEAAVGLRRALSA